MLQVDSLSVEYRGDAHAVRAVDGATFSLETGQTLGIAGESACGKTSLGLALMRSLSGGNASGSVRLDGESILDMDESEFDARYRWKKISMIFQAAMNSLDPVYTVRDQLSEVLKEHGDTRNTAQIVSDALDSVGLDSHVLGQYPHELSGGMRQRIVIAMALLLNPRLVIADEPTTALDVLVQSQIMRVLRGLGGQTSLIFITHDLALLSEIADKIAIMYAGQIVEIADAQEIYENPQHPYTKALIAATPSVDGTPPQAIPGRAPQNNPKGPCSFAPRCAHVFDKCDKEPPAFDRKTGYARCWLYE